ncbi:hypothetical protein [Hymenobacter cheonanensis]|uniref:hypothetical protein n=1 Tax=Hymenobacter sp. CA2-7 TaxID=3063993 RepID=UPI002712D8ED|nr:hypothetical protein [Hymenobacter sp. CA2-7]MDO7884268.1 hypothetical protein [Hymenobacter sp. CA2-7]
MIEDCDKDNQAAFIKKLTMYSRMTWDEIRVAPRHGLGAEKIKRDAINASIPSWATADVSFFLSFRYNGKKPFVGHQRDQVFHVFWIDHDFSVYDHGGS